MKSQTFFRLAWLVGILGAYVGYVTVDRYEIIVRATLGLTVLYLLYREIFLPKGIPGKPVEDWMEIPVALRYLVVAFLVTIIAFWASIQVLHLVWYLRDLFANR